jgi:predicted glycosyltransferase
MERGYNVLISIKDKDILKDLVKDYEYIQLSEGYRKKKIYSILKSVINRDKKLLKIVRKFQPDLMIGTSPEIGHISPFTKIPALFFGEDDVDLSIPMYLGALTCYPLFKCIISPLGVNNSFWNRKTINYKGFQKLAYLHPNYFQPERSKVDVPLNTRFFLLRFANLQAYHDINAKGISDSLASELITILKTKGKVIITSERKSVNMNLKGINRTFTIIFIMLTYLLVIVKVWLLNQQFLVHQIFDLMTLWVK